MLIKNFIINRLRGPNNLDYVFKFWSPVCSPDHKTLININIEENKSFIKSLVEGDYESALGISSSHFRFYQWLNSDKVNVFTVDLDKKTIFLKSKHKSSGYSIEDWNLFYSVATATVLWAFLVDDPNFKEELELGEKSNNKLIKKLFEIVQTELPDYNLDSAGVYQYVA